MRPQWSIIFFTTLAGAAQGFLVALAGVEVRANGSWTASIYAHAAWTVLALLALGLAASVFHLGRPERAWRAVSQWRTSWLSREVIVLPALMIFVGLHALLLQWGADPASAGVRTTALVAVLLCLGLWLCTGNIYMSLTVIREWATPLTLLSFASLGLASGTGLAGLWFACAMVGNAASWAAQSSVATLCAMAWVLTLAAGVVKGAWWNRRCKLRFRSTLQSALGIDRPRIRQLSMGMTGGSFNTREFFHGQSGWMMRLMPMLMLVLGALLPLLAYAAAWQETAGAHTAGSVYAMGLGFLFQLIGIFAERWLFFAWVQHPQNLYYQRVS